MVKLTLAAPYRAPAPEVTRWKCGLRTIAPGGVVVDAPRGARNSRVRTASGGRSWHPHFGGTTRSDECLSEVPTTLPGGWNLELGHVSAHGRGVASSQPGASGAVNELCSARPALQVALLRSHYH